MGYAALLPLRHPHSTRNDAFQKLLSLEAAEAARMMILRNRANAPLFTFRRSGERLTAKTVEGSRSVTVAREYPRCNREELNI